MGAESTTPWGAIGQAALGGIQGIIGGISAHKNQRKLEKMIDQYKPNESIMDYYSKALNRYNANPYTSAQYQNSQKNIQRSGAAAIAGATDRRAGLGMLSSIAQGQNDALGDAAARAEQQQGQNLAQLGQATGMKAGEDKYKFEAKYNLLSQKAGSANQTANAGISNLFGGLGGIQDYAMIDRMYNSGQSGTVNSNNPGYNWGKKYRVPNY